MFRVLLVFLMIAQVAVCPFSCAAELADCHATSDQVEPACSCCANCDSHSDRSAPQDQDESDDACSCFCNGSAMKAAVVSHTQDTQSIWIALTDPPMPLVAFADLERAQPPIGDGSGKAVRLAVQSLLL